jgi:hypothetical protein
MINQRKHPSAKNIKSADVDAYIDSLGGPELTVEQKKELDRIHKKNGLGKYAKKDS